MADFKEIGPLNYDPDRVGLAAVTCRGSIVRLYQTAWDLADAKALYEWLGRALAVSDTGADANG